MPLGEPAALLGRRRQNQRQGYLLLTGLDDPRLIKNPSQVYRELLAHNANSERQPNHCINNELTELRLQLEDEDGISLPGEPVELSEVGNKLPRLIGTRGNVAGQQQQPSRVGAATAGGCLAATVAAKQPFLCRCPVLEVDLQRVRYCDSRRDRHPLDPPRPTDSDADADKAQRTTLSPEIVTPLEATDELCKMDVPDCESQLDAFGRLGRNKVAKRLKLAKRIRRALAASGQDAYYGAVCGTTANEHVEETDDQANNDHLSLALYKLEALLREANVNLAANLSRAAGQSALRLGSILAESESSNSLNQADAWLAGSNGSLVGGTGLWDQDGPIVMIRAPVSTKRQAAFRRRWWLAAGTTSSQSADSGIGEPRQLPNEASNGANLGPKLKSAPTSTTPPFGALDWHVKLRSSEPIQAIVAYSISLFGSLIEACALFKPSASGGIISPAGEPATSRSLADLKLAACVECQKLRATIRFQWIAECLRLAFARNQSRFPLGAVNGTERIQLNEKIWQRIEPADFTASAKASKRQEPLDGRRLPALDEQLARERSLELRYLDLLALVMGQLLRRHFVEPALEQWCNLLERHQFLAGTSEQHGRGRLASAFGGWPSLLVQVELVEDPAASASQLTCTKPDHQVEQAMAFVVDEIVAVCKHLPRLETQLESEQIELDWRNCTQKPVNKRGIFVIQEENDDLLIKTKARLQYLIQHSLPIGEDLLTQDSLNSGSIRERAVGVRVDRKGVNIDGRQTLERHNHDTADWIDRDYLFAIKLVNSFRSGSIANLNLSPLIDHLGAGIWPHQASKLDLLDTSRNKRDANNSKTSEREPGVTELALNRLRQLHFSCQQIRLLDLLELRLNSCSGTYYDFGFIMLDCEPLRRSLVACAQRERNLLVRLNLDDQLRLMERLKLQFDEIELGLDLETAIEDHLAEKRQAKRREQPQQQLLLTGADNINDADDNEDDADLVPLETAPFSSQSAVDLGERHNLVPVRALVDEIGTSGELASAVGGAFPAQPNKGSAKLESLNEDKDEEEEFVNALMSGNNNAAQANEQLLVLRGTTAGGSATAKSGSQILAAEELTGNLERRVAPLIECQLLVARYEYLSKLLNEELEPFVDDLALAFEGLVFMSEFVGPDQLEASHSDLISELSSRSQEFNSILSGSLSGLNGARFRLIKLNNIRRKVLSKLVIEFHLLMGVIGQRRLVSSAFSQVAAEVIQPPAQQSPASVSAPVNGGLNIRQLDSIQETSDWVQKLEVRFDFLLRQNSLLAREHELLSRAELTCSKQLDSKTMPSDPMIASSPGLICTELLADQEVAHSASKTILDRWRLLAKAIANLWRLAEDYETQQVKWLNSDIKRIDFAQIDRTFSKFQSRLSLLEESCQKQLDELQQGVDKELVRNLFANFVELQARMNQFATMRIPIFKFLTNKHLTSAHWERLTCLLIDTDEREPAPSLKGLKSSTISPQACTTLAQFLELNVDSHINELIEMDREAINENQLTMFLLAEAARSALLSGNKLAAEHRGVQLNLWQLDVSGWLGNWSDRQLVIAASKFIETKLMERSPSLQYQQEVDCMQLGSKLVNCHSLAKRYLSLRFTLNLELPNTRKQKNSAEQQTSSNSIKVVTIRSNYLLTSSEMVRPALFVEFLRLFTENWIEAQIKLATRIDQYEGLIKTLSGHLDDIDQLVERVRQVHDDDLHRASVESEQMLAHLEQQTIKLELEREILATKEALAVERQRQALKTRDECIRQITERAIPAIRAATKALDCLDERSLRFLRCIKPSPPEPVKLVIEAVCLLRSCAVASQVAFKGNNKHQVSPMQTTSRRRGLQLEPERHFDAVRGVIIEDYWPTASRMLIGTHSSRFISDLRQVDKKTIPVNLMNLIRRRYLSSIFFNVRLIEKVSRECALLAKWLIAVDVFDRVINVARPSYHTYLESERKLNELLLQVDDRKRQIEAIGSELQEMEDSLEVKLSHKMNLIDSFEQCKSQLKQIEVTRLELINRRTISEDKLDRFKRKRRRVANRCLMRAARIVYVEAMRLEERKPMINLLKKTIST